MSRRTPSIDLTAKAGPFRFANPVLLASGTFGGIQERVMDLRRLGAVVLKTVTREPRKGNPAPRIHETPAGMLNSIGLENKGLDGFVKADLPRALDWGVKVIVNFAGADEKEWGEMAARLAAFRKIYAVELNISCPNVSGGLDYGVDPRLTERVVRIVKKRLPFPVIAKLTPNVTDVVRIAGAALEGGADGLSLVNTLKGLAIDWRRRKPILGAITGGLSGPAIRPVAVRMVWEVCSAYPMAPVIGIGGISTADDALEFVCAGAFAIEVGTASFVDPHTGERLVDALPKALASAGVRRLRELRGTISVKHRPARMCD